MLEAGLGTLVPKVSIEHTAGDQLRSLACVCKHLTRLNLSPGFRNVLIIAREARRLALLQSGNHTRRAELFFWKVLQPLAAFQLRKVAEDV